MWGKLFKSAFTGSLQGSGANAFAVWSYILAHAETEFVEINPTLVAVSIGITKEEVAECLAMFGSPDPLSRSDKEEGRRLIHQRAFSYWVVNWSQYNVQAKAKDMREAETKRKRDYREKSKMSQVCPGHVPTVPNAVPDMSRTFSQEEDEDEYEPEAQYTPEAGAGDGKASANGNSTKPAIATNAVELQLDEYGWPMPK